MLNASVTSILPSFRTSSTEIPEPRDSTRPRSPNSPQPGGKRLLPRAIAGIIASVAADRSVPGAQALHPLAAGAALLPGVHLVLNLVLTIISTERQRRRHRQLLILLGSPDPSRPRTHLIDNATLIPSGDDGREGEGAKQAADYGGPDEKLGK